jgi:hypothetical protein
MGLSQNVMPSAKAATREATPVAEEVDGVPIVAHE